MRLTLFISYNYYVKFHGFYWNQSTMLFLSTDCYAHLKRSSPRWCQVFFWATASLLANDVTRFHLHGMATIEASSSFLCFWWCWFSVCRNRSLWCLCLLYSVPYWTYNIGLSTTLRLCMSTCVMCVGSGWTYGTISFNNSSVVTTTRVVMFSTWVFATSRWIVRD